MPDAPREKSKTDDALDAALNAAMNAPPRPAREVPLKRQWDDELEAGSNEKLMFGQAHPNTNSDFLFGAPLYDVNGG